jgi:hypothetical protein
MARFNFLAVAAPAVCLGASCAPALAAEAAVQSTPVRRS